MVDTTILLLALAEEIPVGWQTTITRQKGDWTYTFILGKEEIATVKTRDNESYVIRLDELFRVINPTDVLHAIRHKINSEIDLWEERKKCLEDMIDKLKKERQENGQK